jgi:hypothetical protein
LTGLNRLSLQLLKISLQIANLQGELGRETVSLLTASSGRQSGLLGLRPACKNTDTCVPRRSQRSRLPNAHVELRVTQQKPLRVAWTEQISKSRSGNFVMLDRLRARPELDRGGVLRHNLPAGRPGRSRYPVRASRDPRVGFIPPCLPTKNSKAVFCRPQAAAMPCNIAYRFQARSEGWQL